MNDVLIGIVGNSIDDTAQFPVNYSKANNDCQKQRPCHCSETVHPTLVLLTH